jgi:uncharacterized protein (TIGR03067 family)
MLIRILALSILLPVLCVQPGRAQTEEIQEKIEKNLKAVRAMQGTWKVVAMERNGVKTSDDDLKNFHVTIKSYHVTADDGRKIQEADFVLNTDPTPKSIHFVSKDNEGKKKNQPGIFELDGDTLKICYVHEGKDAKLPIEFASKPESGHTLVVLKKEK